MVPAKKPFQYKIPRPKYEVEAVKRTKEEPQQEALTGYVRGQVASDLEERFANALDKMGGIRGWEFQPTAVGIKNVQGELRPDFIIYSDTPVVVQIDGEFAHKSAEQKATDQIKDGLLYEALKDYGFLPPVRVPGTYLETPEEAETVAKTVITEGRIF